MESCVCSEIDIADLQPGDVYHTAQPGDHVIDEMIADGSMPADTLKQHNETLFFTVKETSFDGEDTWTIVNEFDEGSVSYQGEVIPKLFLVYRPQEYP